MKKIILIVFLIIVAIAGVGLYVTNKTEPKVIASPNAQISLSPTAIQTSPTQKTSVPTTTKTFTITEVMRHNNRTTCWSAIEGNVYDLTNWIDKHPGGPEKILGICGTDGTAKFLGIHATKPEARQALPQFLIGTLEK